MTKEFCCSQVRDGCNKAPMLSFQTIGTSMWDSGKMSKLVCTTNTKSLDHTGKAEKIRLTEGANAVT